VLGKESHLPTSLAQFLSFIALYKAAFVCLYKLLLIAVTFPVTSVHARDVFKNEISENIFRNSMTSERLSSNVLLSVERVRAEKNRFGDFVN